MQGPAAGRMARHMLPWFYTPPGSASMAKTRQIAAVFWAGVNMDPSKFQVMALSLIHI